MKREYELPLWVGGILYVVFCVSIGWIGDTLDAAPRPAELSPPVVDVGTYQASRNHWKMELEVHNGP